MVPRTGVLQKMHSPLSLLCKVTQFPQQSALPSPPPQCDCPLKDGSLCFPPPSPPMAVHSKVVLWTSLPLLLIGMGSHQRRQQREVHTAISEWAVMLRRQGGKCGTPGKSVSVQRRWERGLHGTRGTPVQGLHQTRLIH